MGQIVIDCPHAQKLEHGDGRKACGKHDQIRRNKTNKQTANRQTQQTRLANSITAALLRGCHPAVTKSCCEFWCDYELGGDEGMTWWVGHVPEYHRRTRRGLHQHPRDCRRRGTRRPQRGLPPSRWPTPKHGRDGQWRRHTRIRN